MALVDYQLRNFGLANINHLDPVVIFTPNKPAVGTGGQIFATDPIESVPGAGGEGQVNLEPTDGLLTPDVFYTIRVQWRRPGIPGLPEKAQGRMVADYPEWKLYVPAGGGVFGDLIGQKVSPGLVITSPVAPPKIYGLAAMWLQLDPDDPDNPLNPANTGDLYELRNI